MARIASVDIPKNKRGVISLTYIFGIGPSRSKEILSKAPLIAVAPSLVAGTLLRAPLNEPNGVRAYDTITIFSDIFD